MITQYLKGRPRSRLDLSAVSLGFQYDSPVPTDYLTSLYSWYDTSDSVSSSGNGSRVRSITDKGSKGNNLTTISGNPWHYTNVQNGKGAIFFNGTSFIAGSAQGSEAQPQTHFLVITPTGWGAGDQQEPVSMYNNSQCFYKPSGATTINTYAGNTLAGPSIGNNPYIIAATFDSSQSILSVNGSSYYTGNTSTGVASHNPTIGANGSSFGYTGYFMEWRVYKGLLTLAHIAQVKTYLNYKWAIY